MFDFSNIELTADDLCPPELQPARIVVGTPAERYCTARAGRSLSSAELDELITLAAKG